MRCHVKSSSSVNKRCVDDTLNYWKKNHSTLGLEKAWGNPCFATENPWFSRSKHALKYPNTTFQKSICAKEKNLLG
jgi:hypothetical protein